MKPRVFLSYTGDSTPKAKWIRWYLTEILHVQPVDYQDDASRASGSGADALRAELRMCDLFIQILESSLGKVFAAISSEPVLKWELTTFMENHANDYRRGLLLNFNTGDQDVRDYVAALTDRLNPKNPNDERQMLTAVHRFLEQMQNTHDGLVGGYIDFRRGGDLLRIADDLQRNIGQPNDVIIEQKHLYSSPYAASLWMDLLKNASAPLKAWYETFPFCNDARQQVIRKESATVIEPAKRRLGAWIEKLRTATALPRVNVVVLGGGECYRELRMCKWLIRQFETDGLSVLLADISVDLLCVALQRFVDSGSDCIDVAFAIVDFERGAEAIEPARRRLLPDAPALFMFFGPTLSNVDDLGFLRNLARSMRTGDVIFFEVLFCNGDKTFEFRESNASGDPRFKFITNPMLTIGELPDSANFWEEFKRYGDEYTTRVWFYRKPDYERINLCAVKYFTKAYCERIFRDAGFRDVEVLIHAAPIASVRGVMGYVIAERA